LRCGRVGQVELLLEEVDPEHLLQPERMAASTRLRVVGSISRINRSQGITAFMSARKRSRRVTFPLTPRKLGKRPLIGRESVPKRPEKGGPINLFIPVSDHHPSARRSLGLLKIHLW
jgi:hypothetical protein